MCIKNKYIIILSVFSLVFSGIFIVWNPSQAQPKEYLKVISPDGEEQLQPEKIYEIKWESSGIENVGIVLYKDKTIAGVIARNIPAEVSKILWTPSFNLEDGEDYRIAVYQYPWSIEGEADYSDGSFAIKRKIISLAAEKYFSLGASPDRITPEEILHFNPHENSGWIYIAQTAPEKGMAFWVAAMRSFSTQPTDTSAQLLYGITNINTGEYYSGFIKEGSFSESKNKVDLFFQKDGEKLLEFRQEKEDLSEFKLAVNLPFHDSFYQATKILKFNRPILYMSGDGIIPMGGGIDSLYVSLVLEQGFWVDFQKFNLPVGLTPVDVIGGANANHRWMSFILEEEIHPFAAGTVGVGWEILDEDGQRQPGGYTNVDLLIPGWPQITASEEQTDQIKITEINHWKSPHSLKTYLKKWEVSYPDPATAPFIKLLFETIMPDQENEIEMEGVLFHFYEGMIKVMHPQTGEQVGTGMLEQTHDEF